MKKTIFVISDLHLGGGEGFQMCSPAGQTNLAAFIRWAKGQHSKENAVRLIINGDFVDFLAEEPFAEFTDNDTAATGKLREIIKRTQDVWDALAEFVANGAALTILLGNHDIELSLPGPRRLLLETVGAGRVEFIYDGQAFVDGPVIVEHGNRYEKENFVSHDSLLEVREAISRGETPPEMKRILGSAMVNTIINPLKKDHPFIDLLKPETTAMVPLLAVLDPSTLLQLRDLRKLPYWDYLTIKQPRLSDGKKPSFRGPGLSPTSLPEGESSEMKAFDDAFAYAANLVLGEQISRMPPRGRPTRVMRGVVGSPSAFWADLESFFEMSREFLEKKIEQIKENWTHQKKDKLFDALRYFAKNIEMTFDGGTESAKYAEPAQALVDRGFRVVVFGHTHLAKRVSLNTENGEAAVYLNSGTWADLMRLPDAFFATDEGQARQSFETFYEKLERNELDGLRERISTFAQIRLDGEKVLEAQVYRFLGGSELPEPYVKK